MRPIHRFTAVLAAAAAFFATAAHAIGLQHALFRSQSTQGKPWMGTVHIVKESYLITVHPDYLDVELDWELGVGGVKPAEHEKALEIVGNINFEKDASVIGMLAYYKGMLLKAKLKTNEFARKEYEDVVDRDAPAPQPPRDPVLLEWIRDDNYDLSIFPVEWGGTRRLRIRYLIPSDLRGMGYPHAFSDKATAVIRAGKGVQAFDLVLRDTRTVRMIQATLGPQEYELQAYGYSRRPNPARLVPVLADGHAGSRIFIGAFAGHRFAGEMAKVSFRIPPALLTRDILGANPQVFATVTAGAEKIEQRVGILMDGGVPDDLRVYARAPLYERIDWAVVVNGETVKRYRERPRIHRMEDGLQYARSFGNAALTPLSKTMPGSLGLALGFIDVKYTLVALEKDALPSALRTYYWKTGVPVLGREDIHPDPQERYDVPAATWLAERWVRKALLPGTGPIGGMPTTRALESGLPEGIRYAVADGRLEVRVDPALLRSGQTLRIAIFDLQGKLIREWLAQDFGAGLLTWSPGPLERTGAVYLLKVALGSRSFSERVTLK